MVAKAGGGLVVVVRGKYVQKDKGWLPVNMGMIRKAFTQRVGYIHGRVTKGRGKRIAMSSRTEVWHVTLAPARRSTRAASTRP